MVVVGGSGGSGGGGSTLLVVVAVGYSFARERLERHDFFPLYNLVIGTHSFHYVWLSALLI